MAQPNAWMVLAKRFRGHRGTYPSAGRRSQIPSAQRNATAWIVDVGLTPPPVARLVLSAMKRLGTSWAWLLASTTDVAESLPILAAPIRCQPSAGEIPKSRTLLAPDASMSSVPFAIIAAPSRLLFLSKL